MKSDDLRLMAFAVSMLTLLGIPLAQSLGSQKLAAQESRYMRLADELSRTKSALRQANTRLEDLESQFPQRDLRKCQRRVEDLEVRMSRIYGLEVDIETCLAQSERQFYEIVEMQSECDI